MEPDVTDLLLRAESAPGAGSTPELFAALYDELHRVAARQLRRNGGEGALSTTTLVHEVYLDLCGRSGTEFPDRARFIAYVARAMRGIVIDHVRYSRATKRGGGAFEITLTGSFAVVTQQNDAEELQQLSDALDRLAELEPSLAELVDLHFFCGYGLAEIAELRQVSERTVQRSWRKARLLLRHEMLEATAGESDG